MLALRSKQYFNEPSIIRMGRSILDGVLTKIHEFQMALNTNMKEMSTLVDLDNWWNNAEVLNRVVKWMLYKQCQFNEIVHENNKGYSTDTQGVIRVGDDCVYPFTGI